MLRVQVNMAAIGTAPHAAITTAAAAPPVFSRRWTYRTLEIVSEGV